MKQIIAVYWKKSIVTYFRKVVNTKPIMRDILQHIYFSEWLGNHFSTWAHDFQKWFVFHCALYLLTLFVLEMAWGKVKAEKCAFVLGDGACGGMLLLLHGNTSALSRKCTFKGVQQQRCLCIHPSLSRRLQRLINSQPPFLCATVLYGQFGG